MKENLVLIEFENPEQASEFVMRFDKVREKGSTPLYNSLLISTMKPIKDVKLVSCSSWNKLLEDLNEFGKSF